MNNLSLSWEWKWYFFNMRQSQIIDHGGSFWSQRPDWEELIRLSFVHVCSLCSCLSVKWRERWRMATQRDATHVGYSMTRRLIEPISSMIVPPFCLSSFASHLLFVVSFYILINLPFLTFSFVSLFIFPLHSYFFLLSWWTPYPLMLSHFQYLSFSMFSIFVFKFWHRSSSIIDYFISFYLSLFLVSSKIYFSLFSPITSFLILSFRLIFISASISAVLFIPLWSFCFSFNPAHMLLKCKSLWNSIVWSVGCHQSGEKMNPLNVEILHRHCSRHKFF